MQHLRKKRLAQLCCAAPPRPLEGQASCRRCGSRLGKEVHCHAHPRRAAARGGRWCQNGWMRQAGLPNLLRVRRRTLPFERQSLLNLALHVLLGRLDGQEEWGASYAPWADVVAAQARRRQARWQARWRHTGAEAAGAEAARPGSTRRESDGGQTGMLAPRVTPNTIFCETLQLNRSLSCHWQRLTKGTANRSVSQKEPRTAASHKRNYTASHKRNCSVSHKELRRLT